MGIPAKNPNDYPETKPHIVDAYSPEGDFAYCVLVGEDRLTLTRNSTIIYWDSKGMLMSHVYHVCEDGEGNRMSYYLYDQPELYSALRELGYQEEDMWDDQHDDMVDREVESYCDYAEDVHLDFTDIGSTALSCILEEYAHYRLEQLE